VKERMGVIECMFIPLLAKDLFEVIFISLVQDVLKDFVLIINLEAWACLLKSNGNILISL